VLNWLVLPGDRPVYYFAPEWDSTWRLTPTLDTRAALQNLGQDRAKLLDKGGVVTSLPAKAVVEIHGPSELGIGMVEVAWKDQRFAVFERDLKVRGSLVPTQAVGD
jgi:hypothetical protein